jgi:SOS response regulatory protein OraA/RecX
MKSDETGKKNKKTATEAAYAYLASRMRTTEEVRKYLEGKEYPESEITETLNDLIGMRYLDDYLYAARYYEYNRDKKRGVMRAERELIEKGIDRETVRNAKEDFLYEQGVDEYSDALEIARKEVYTKKDIYGDEVVVREMDDRLSAKIARRLESKGFSRADIFRVLDTLRRETGDND